MNIAMITMTRNDDCRFREWKEHYEEYKNDLFLHIIVDNGSTEEYRIRLKDSFPDSRIIELGYNGGCTAAYNAGIKYALEQPEVDAISLLANDVRMLPGTLPTLCEVLYSENDYGMASPVSVRLNDENIAVAFGETINRKNMDLVAMNKGAAIDTLPEILISETLPGGNNLAKREFYEKVGLQDEKFFMYADEVDMGIRGERAGFKFVTTTKAKTWHMHINPPGQVNRNPMAAYLMGRNHIYLARKLFGRKEVFHTIMHRLKIAAVFFLSCLKHHKNKEEYRYAWAFIKGVFAGIRGDMRNNFD